MGDGGELGSVGLGVGLGPVGAVVGVGGGVGAVGVVVGDAVGEALGLVAGVGDAWFGVGPDDVPDEAGPDGEPAWPVPCSRPSPRLGWALRSGSVVSGCGRSRGAVTS